jgi:hypothetical protein
MTRLLIITPIRIEHRLQAGFWHLLSPVVNDRSDHRTISFASVRIEEKKKELTKGRRHDDDFNHVMA